jgi:putative transposase
MKHIQKRARLQPARAGGIYILTALLQNLEPIVAATILQQMNRIIEAMLSMSGRITMLGLSRWTTKGGSYRTIQRFYHSSLCWVEMQWIFFTRQLWKASDEYLLVGDEVVVDKAGKETFGLGRFFSSIHQRPVSAISFFAFSLVSVQERQSYPLQVTQIVKEKEAQPVKVKKPKEKRGPGRPKGSRNKTDQAVVLLIFEK